MVAGSTETIRPRDDAARAPRHTARRPSTASAGGSRARRPCSPSRRPCRASSGSCGRWSSAYFFGVSGKINAFTVAIQIPNLVRALVADAALSGAFVPVFSELLERGERKRAWRVASTLFWLTLLILGGLTALFILLAPLLMKPFGQPGRRLRPRGRALAGALPDRRPARPVGDRRRDPQHVPPLRVAGARAGRVEPRDRPRPRPRGAADRERERAALPLCGRRRPRDGRPAPAPDPVAAAARRAPDDGARLARPRRPAGARR